MTCPKKVVACEEGVALVESGGKRTRVRTPIPLAKGEFVLCQAGFVVKKVPAETAQEMLKEFDEMNDFRDEEDE